MFNDIFKNKSVLVTGHTGFKGSWLSQWLTMLNAKVHGYSLYLPSDPCHFESISLKNRMSSVMGDILDYSTLKQAFDTAKPEAVFHLAAQPIVSTAIQDPITSYKTNVIGTLNVLEAIRSTPSVRAAVIITSDKCYENAEWEFGYRENDRLGGKDPYSASKACAEILFSSHFRTYLADISSLQIATARAGNVIGGGDWARDRIVSDTVRAWSTNQKSIIRSPKSTRPWQHVLEPLSGYLSLAAGLLNRTPHLNGEAFNFGPPPDVNVSVETLLIELQKSWASAGWNVETSNLAKKEAGLLKLNCDKALARLDWRPVLTFEETANLTSSWYKKFYESSSTNMLPISLSQIEAYCGLAQSRSLSWTRKT
jgi:CDP-glucose 4,6-dehydratase